MVVNKALGNLVAAPVTIGVVAEVLVSATEEPVRVLGLELASIASTVLVTSSVLTDAETNWLEGASLLLAYSVLGVEFLFF